MHRAAGNANALTFCTVEKWKLAAAADAAAALRGLLYLRLSTGWQFRKATKRSISSKVNNTGAASAGAQAAKTSHKANEHCTSSAAYAT